MASNHWSCRSTSRAMMSMENVRLPKPRPDSPTSRISRSPSRRWAPTSRSQARSVPPHVASVPLLVYFLAGLAELLHGETGQTDIALQTNVNVRPLLGAQPLIGGFNCLTYVRLDLSKRLNRRELLFQTRDSFSRACAHALVSPMELVPAHAGRVNLGFAQGYDAAFALGDAVATPTSIPDTIVMPFDLRPTLMLDGQQLTVVFGYNTRLFRHETIERLCKRYLAVLQSIGEDPDGNVAGRRA